MNLDRSVFLEVVRHTPLISIDLVIRDDAGRVLIGLRNNEPARDTWFVPGGRILKDETLDAAFLRISSAELGRETGRDEARFLGVYEHLYDANFAGEPDVTTHYVVLAHELRHGGGTGSLPPLQHRGYRWMTPDELLADRTVHENTRAYFVG